MLRVAFWYLYYTAIIGIVAALMHRYDPTVSFESQWLMVGTSLIIYLLLRNRHVKEGRSTANVCPHGWDDCEICKERK